MQRLALQPNSPRKPVPLVISRTLSEPVADWRAADRLLDGDEAVQIRRRSIESGMLLLQRQRFFAITRVTVVLVCETVEGHHRSALWRPAVPFHEQKTVVLVGWKLAIVQVWQLNVGREILPRAIVLIITALDSFFLPGITLMRRS